MQDLYLSTIRPDMEVCDNAGEKIGTVARVHALVTASVSGADSTPSSEQGYVEVKTGVLGLGPRYYVPASAIADATDGGVFLTVSREAIETLGWQTRPADLHDH